jgi:hypothetical protein
MNTITHRPYHQDADQRERERILRNDRANTFAGRAQAEADDVRGRWAQEHKATVIGAGPVEYPRLPENSWTHDPVPPEGPVGVSVEDLEPVGEPREILASLETIGDPTTGSHQPASSPRHDERGFVGPPLAGAKANASVDDPSRTGGAEAPKAVLAPASPAEVSPRPPIPQPTRRPR